jgi:hypothetical protein
MRELAGESVGTGPRECVRLAARSTGGQVVTVASEGVA